MIDWLNNTFGIKNEVSVPILISLIVFLVGGLAKYILSRINDYNERLKTRTTIFLLIKEVIPDLKVKEKHTAEFYPTLTPSHRHSWQLKYTTVNYLETFFDLDFNEVYYAFRKKFFWSCSKRIKNRAFHRIWATLRNLKFFENRIEKDLEDLTYRFGMFHKNYVEKLDIFRKKNDQMRMQFNGRIPKSETRLLNYLNAQNKIWTDWKEIDSEERTAYYTTYNHLVLPILELNRNNIELSFTNENTNALLDCVHQYIEIENVLKIYQNTFKLHSRNYRNGNRVLKKCLEIID